TVPSTIQRVVACRGWDDLPRSAASPVAPRIFWFSGWEWPCLGAVCEVTVRRALIPQLLLYQGDASMSVPANHPPPTQSLNGCSLEWAAPAPRGRPSWSGLLRLSLVVVPVKAYAAVSSSRAPPPCHLLHAECGQRIAYHKHCSRHGAVPAEAIVRGY